MGGSIAKQSEYGHVTDATVRYSDRDPATVQLMLGKYANTISGGDGLPSISGIGLMGAIPLSADRLLLQSIVRIQFQTGLGKLIAKILPYDGYVNKVIQACSTASNAR